MSPEDLQQTLRDWQLNAAQASKVLCVHTTRMSEYLDGVSRIPCSVAMHIDALNRIDHKQRNSLFKERIERKSHSRS